MSNKINFAKALGVIAIFTIIGAVVLIHDAILDMIDCLRK